MVGRSAGTEPGRVVPGASDAPPAPAASVGRLAATLWPCPPSRRVGAAPRSPSSCSPPAAPRMRAASFDPTGRVHDRRPAAGRLPRPRGARPDDLRGAPPGDARFRAQLHAEQPRAARVARHRRGPLRRRDVDVRRRAGGRPGRVPHDTASTADDLADVLHAERAQTAAGRRSPGDRGRRSPAGPAAGSTRRPASGPRRSSSGRRPSPTSSTSSSRNDLPDARIQDAIDAFGGR